MARSKKTAKERAVFLLNILLACFSANCCLLLRLGYWQLIPLAVLALILSNVPPFFSRKLPTGRLRLCHHGVTCLKVFLWAIPFSLVYQLSVLLWLPGRWLDWCLSLIVCVCVQALLFWNGIISVYCASVQLGIRRRAVGILCGFIPIVRLFVLGRILKTVSQEVDFESEKIALNKSRKQDAICATKYPILLVHGVFFRDFKYLNYWGRIPQELERNGARVYYGNHQSAAPVAGSAVELTRRIREILAETGCEKVNIIAHSKGGLDCRHAIHFCGAAPYVASLTTINTPHRGCGFADYLLNALPEKLQDQAAGTYNAAMRKLGDESPDFLAACRDLTASACAPKDKEMQAQGVFCQSVGSRLNRAVSGKFPLNFTFPLVKYFDGPNDGLVAESSFRFGARYTFLTTEGPRGISHGDMIDMNRENIPGFDVREFYVQLVHGLKQQGF